MLADELSPRGEWLATAIAATLTADEQATLVRAGELMTRLAEFDPGVVRVKR